MPTHLLGVIVAARCRNGPSIDFLDQLDLTIEIETETIESNIATIFCSVHTQRVIYDLISADLQSSCQLHKLKLSEFLPQLLQ